MPGPLLSAELMMSGTWPPGGCHSTTAVLDPDLATWRVSMIRLAIISIISNISIAIRQYHHHLELELGRYLASRDSGSKEAGVRRLRRSWCRLTWNYYDVSLNTMAAIMIVQLKSGPMIPMTRWQ